MKLTQKFFMLVFLTSTNITTYAQTDISRKYQSMYDSCTNKSKLINNSVIYTCAETISEKVKAHINITYKQLYNKLQRESSYESAKLLENEQKSWLNFRNASCEFEGHFVGSPMYSICPMNSNIERLQILTDRLN